MKIEFSRLNCAAAFILFTYCVTPAFAETSLIVCPAANGAFVFSVDFDKNTVSTSSEGAPYTVPATITEQKISWTSANGDQYSREIDRVTGVFKSGAYTATCHKGEKQF